jgi:GT2 family glycosyltransferase
MSERMRERTTPEQAGQEEEVAVLIVTHNEADDLPACLVHVAAQTHRPLSVVLVDCASQDESLAVARATQLADIPFTVVDAGANLGFAGGMNEALRHTQAPFVLTLNADAHLEPGFIATLLAHMVQPSGRVGAATGRLLRFPDPDGGQRLDACGMHLTTNWRHLDRGAGDLDHGQLATAERVFGATGAAALLARQALDDVRFPADLFPASEHVPGTYHGPHGPVFDPDFFTFREDAELCFRLQARGWQVVYEPAARALHRRANLPSRRRTISPIVNYHGVKNRFLLRAYHQTLGNFLRTLLPTLIRDGMVIGYVLVRERTSLPAFTWLWRHRRLIRARRRFVQRRRKSSVDRWFHHQALPLPTAPDPAPRADR